MRNLSTTTTTTQKTTTTTTNLTSSITKTISTITSLTTNLTTTTDSTNINNLKRYDVNRNTQQKQQLTNRGATIAFTFDTNCINQEYNNKIPPAPHGPPPPAPKTHKSNIIQSTTKVPTTHPNGKVSIRQDSSISSDSFSQTSSPSYTTKTIETPLLPPRTPPAKPQNGLLTKIKDAEDDANGNTTITKSVSTPASLQTIVRFHNGSNMSLHHRV